MNQRQLAVLIMAAGQGKRMKNPDKAKVMHTIAGIPLIEHVVRLARSCNATRIIVIVGHQRQSVIEHLRACAPDVEITIQEPQFGTGHAVLQAQPLLQGFDGDVLILSGDAPLTRPRTLSGMMTHHRISQAVVTVLTAKLPDPSGYGRIVRDSQNHIVRIVEHKDATENELRIDEINSGIYVFDCRTLFEALSRVTNDNAQGEYYLPDVFGIFADRGKRMEPYVVDSFDEIRGVNTIEQLREMETIFEDRSSSDIETV